MGKEGDKEKKRERKKIEDILSKKKGYVSYQRRFRGYLPLFTQVMHMF